MITKNFNQIKHELQSKGIKNLSNIRLEIIDRKSRLLGRAWHKARKIEINKAYFNTPKLEKNLRNTILHEFFHIIAYDTYKKNVGHSKEYKDLIESYGYNRKIGMATQKMRTTSKVEYKYNVYCTECGRFICKSARNNSKRYISKCCRAKLRYESIDK